MQRSKAHKVMLTAALASSLFLSARPSASAQTISAAAHEKTHMPIFNKPCVIAEIGVDYSGGIVDGLKAYESMRAGINHVPDNIMLIDNVNVTEEKYADWCKSTDMVVSNLSLLEAKLHREHQSDGIVIQKCVDYVKEQMPEMSDCQAVLLLAASRLHTKVVPLSTVSSPEESEYMRYRQEWSRAWSEGIKNGTLTLDEMAERSAELHDKSLAYQRSAAAKAESSGGELGIERRMMQALQIFPELHGIAAIRAAAYIDFENMPLYVNFQNHHLINSCRRPFGSIEGQMLDKSLTAHLIEESYGKPLTLREKYLFAFSRGPVGEFVRAQQFTDYESRLNDNPAHWMETDDDFMFGQLHKLTTEQLQKIARDSMGKPTLEANAFIINQALYFGGPVVKIRDNMLVQN